MSVAMILAFIGFSGPAFAQSAEPSASEERAKELFGNASVLYEEGNYEAALVAFEEAKRLFPTAELDYNIANCLERLDRLPEAIAAMNRYRAVATADERVTLDRKLAALEARLAEKTAATPPTQPVPLPAPSTGLPAPVTTPREARRPTWWLVGVGAGLAGLGGAGAGVTFGASRSAIEADDRDAYDSARTWNTASIAGAAVGAGLAVVGVALPTKRTTAEVAFGPSGLVLRAAY